MKSRWARARARAVCWSVVVGVFGNLSLCLAADAGAPPGDEAKAQAVSATPVSASALAAPRPLRQGVFRFSTYPAAWTAAQETNRPILVYACSPSCPHCVKMLRETYKSQGVAEFVGSSFESVYIDRSEQPDMAAKLHLRIFPTTIVVSPNNQVIDVIEGYVDAQTLQRRLQTTLAAHQGDATQTR